MEMTPQTTAFLIDRKDVELVKPSKPTPSDVLSFSTIDNNPDLELLAQIICVYRANSSSSDHINHDDLAPNVGADQLDPACLIKEALPKALDYYYPLAGKLKRDGDGDLKITCNAAGVPFLVAKADCQLSSLRYLDGIDVETVKEFVFDFPSRDDPAGDHPLVLQVTKFSCGGFTIGMGLSHSVCDGPGAAQFLRALIELSMGKMEPTVKPVWERERLMGKTIEAIPLHFPMDKASSATSPYLPTSELMHDCFYVTSESIKRLKMRLVKEMMGRNEVPNESLTTVEVLGAFVWRAMFRALSLNTDGKTLFCLTTGIRKLLSPPLPDGYYGNAFVAANVVVTGKDLNEEPLSETVKLIKQSKRTAFQNGYIRYLIDILETTRKQNKKIEASGEATVLTDWRHLNLLEMEFGSWEAVNIVPVPWHMVGCLFLPPANLDPAMKGGVRVLVSLPKEAMPKFKEEMNSLRLGDDHSRTSLVCCCV